MKTLVCEQCGTVIKPDDGGIKFAGLYLCSQKCLDECLEECLDEHVNWNTYSIETIDFEQDGEDEEYESVGAVVDWDKDFVVKADYERFLRIRKSDGVVLDDDFDI